MSHLLIRISVNERYPWHFGRAKTERGRLSVGDYALMDQDQALAVVERKTLQNLPHDFGNLPLLHQAATHLASVPRHALVIEADYADFLTPAKIAPW